MSCKKVEMLRLIKGMEDPEMECPEMEDPVTGDLIMKKPREMITREKSQKGKWSNHEEFSGPNHCTKDSVI